jgi:hypothetical protein
VGNGEAAIAHPTVCLEDKDDIIADLDQALAA